MQHEAETRINAHEETDLNTEVIRLPQIALVNRARENLAKAHPIQPVAVRADELSTDAIGIATAIGNAKVIKIGLVGDFLDIKASARLASAFIHGCWGGANDSVDKIGNGALLLPISLSTLFLAWVDILIVLVLPPNIEPVTDAHFQSTGVAKFGVTRCGR